MPPHFRILIIGGGIAGLAASLGLRHKGHDITVLESTPELQTQGGSLLIPPSAARVLDSYGVWETFRAAAKVPRSHTTFRYADGCVLESISHAAMEETFGYPIIAVTRADYQRMLYEAAVKAGVEVRLGSRIKEIDANLPSITFMSGEKIKGDIIIGADGIKSLVRTTVLATEDVQIIPESIAYQCSIPLPVMRSNPLTSPLMDDSPLHSWYGPRSEMICGSTSGGGAYSITLTLFPSSDDKNADSMEASIPNSANSYRLGDINDLRESVKMFEARVRTFVEMVKPEDCFVWKIAHLPRLDRWVSRSGKVAVLGDAAHAMVPHLGMGAATAVEDGGVLATCLDRAKSAADIPACLHAYERIRKPRTEKIQAAAMVAGIYKSMPDGPEQRKRDRKMAARMDRKNPKYEFWRAGGGLNWLYGYRFLESADEELDKVFGVEWKGDRGARL